MLDTKDATYLGDGLYVTHDGFQIWLFAANGAGVTDRVALEPAVLERFQKWLKEKQDDKVIPSSL